VSAVDVRSDKLGRLVDENVEVQQLGTGFTFTEGPIWNPTEQFLLFSDMPGDTRRRWDEANGVQEVLSPSNKGNGMTLDASGGLIVCEHSTSSLVRMDPDGKNTGREVLASHYEGQELNSPNDVCVKSDGSLWFSDPWYGRMPGFGVERERELGWQGVFRLPAGGSDPKLVVEKEEYEQPNGLCFSPDESLLYINDTPKAWIKVYDVGSDGTLSNGRMFFEGVGSGVIEEGIPDGMKCDEQGNIWVTGPGGVWVISAAGEHLGVIRIPENTGNLTWGGPDWHTLFIPSSTSLYAVETKVGPRREPYMS
jgi:gluconolactonase